jgi:hypothetical protein
MARNRAQGKREAQACSGLSRRDPFNAVYELLREFTCQIGIVIGPASIDPHIAVLYQPIREVPG